jgi:hypothetical protein
VSSAYDLKQFGLKMKEKERFMMKRFKIFKVALIFCVIALAFLVSNSMAATPTPTAGTCTLTVTISSVDGRGSLEVNPPGVIFTGRTTKTYTYPIGTAVTLKGIDYNYTDGAKTIFYRWQGDLTGSQNPATIVMNGNKSVTAVFLHGDPAPRRSTPSPRRNTPTPTPTPTPTRPVTPTPTPNGLWIPYLPTADMVKLTFSSPSTMYVDITFRTSGYRIADPGQIAVAAGVYPDGSTYLSNLTVGTKIEAYTGLVLDVITTLRITYQIHTGTVTYFGFQVFYNGVDRKVKDITIGQPPTLTPTPRRPVTATPTPTPTPTPTIVPGGYEVAYAIQSDWGNGATIGVTITNKTSAAVNGWTLAWTFPGNQTITNLWNGVLTQSGASVSVKDAGFNASIPAGGGSVNFGFNLNYSGTNAKPVSFTLNGVACQVP